MNPDSTRINRLGDFRIDTQPSDETRADCAILAPFGGFGWIVGRVVIFVARAAVCDLATRHGV
jgi:hypothetical protein